MTIMNAPSPAMAGQKRAAVDPGAWLKLGAHAAELHNEAHGLRRFDRLARAAGGALTVLRSLGVRIDPPGPADRPKRPRIGIGSTLTDRELDVLRGMAEGKSNAEIGRDLFVSEDTVKTHARRLFRKVSARDRAHAVATGFRVGLLT